MIIDPATDVEFTQEQHDIWKTLYARQLPQIRKYAYVDYLEEAFNLKLPTDRIPSIQWLNGKK